MNYISEIIELSKCQKLKKEINLSVNSAAYNQVYEYFLSNDTSRKAAHNSREITKLYFLLMLLISSTSSRELNLLDKDIIYDSLSSTKFKSLKKSLVDSKLIECIVSRESIIIDNKQQWLCKPTLFRLVSLNIEHNSTKIVNLKYCKVSNKIINILSLISSPIYIGQHSLQNIDLQKDRAASQLTKNPQPWSLDLFLSFYDRLWVADIVGKFDILRTTRMHAVKKGMRDDNRIYTGFHTLDKTIRSRVHMDNEPLVECFDVHNCHATLINAILPETIPASEKDLYLTKTISGTFYEDVMSWVNSRFSANWNREFAKTAVNKYFNLSRNTIDKANKAKKSVHTEAVCVDAYFTEMFPAIREFITITPKKKCDTATLNDMLNTVETNIITNNICKALYEHHNIHAISLHDGIFVKLSDCLRMPNIVKEFNDSITFYSLFNK